MNSDTTNWACGTCGEILNTRNAFGHTCKAAPLSAPTPNHRRFIKHTDDLSEKAEVESSPSPTQKSKCRNLGCTVEFDHIDDESVRSACLEIHEVSCFRQYPHGIGTEAPGEWVKVTPAPEVTMQMLNDVGMNPFAFRLVSESLAGKKDKHTFTPFSFQFEGVVYSFAPALPSPPEENRDE